MSGPAKPALPINDLLGAMYHGSDHALTCAICHAEMEWDECACCGGDGYEDAYDADPINGSPGDAVKCDYCDGKGGSFWCNTKSCPTSEGLKIVWEPKHPTP